MRWRRAWVPGAAVALVVAAVACGDLRTAPIDDASLDADVAPDDGGARDGRADGRAGDAASEEDAASETDGGPDPCFGPEDPNAAFFDREWIHWPLPPSSPPASSYTSPTPDAVCDRTTGLVWQKAPAQSVTADGGTKTSFTYDEAVSYCDLLSFAGRSDWRLPTRIELLSLVDYETEKPALPAAFPGPLADELFWAVTKDANPNFFLKKYVVSFTYGQAYTVLKSEPHTVRCVRATHAPPANVPGAPAGQYVLTANTALDTTTGLRWQRAQTGAPAPWATQLAACQTLSLDGFTGFRLPTIRELESIYDARAYDTPVWDTSVFSLSTQILGATVLWSSNELGADALILSFVAGQSMGSLAKDQYMGARCVKGP